MSTSPDLTQLNIELSILPQEQSRENIALANTIGREIFGQLRAEHYQIEPLDTETLGVSEFLISLSLLIGPVIQTLEGAAVAKLAEEIVTKVVDLFKRISQRTKTGERKDLLSSLTIKFSSGREIEVRGPLGTVFDEVTVTQEERKEQKRISAQNGNIPIDEIKVEKMVLTVSLRKEQKTL